MPMFKKYRDYFKIDPTYIPAVNEVAFEQNPDMWKKFFPHETFVKFINDTVKVLERKGKTSIWLEGAYGTGKSHAVLTLKRLLDASEEETQWYFQKYNLSEDLYHRFQSVKSGGRILTIYRSGSSSIRGDNRLIFAVQESIEHAFKENGIENKGRNALRDATVRWLSDEDNKSFFNRLITGKYVDFFGGDEVEDVIYNLKNVTGESLSKLMDLIFRVADERGITVLSLGMTDLCNWIREIISVNKLKAIVFIWDEFTEYFQNNKMSLTGFQELCELSETDPFYMIPVTHVSLGLFPEKDQDFKKLNDRFIKPHCVISLPENIAFQLMGAALEKNADEGVLADWKTILEDLISRTQESRKIVQGSSHIKDKEMQDILPIHPYTAMVLKYISSAFDSNQRSMFSFIKGENYTEDSAEEDKKLGFQWFIDNYGPEDDNPLLTIDLLWGFFYENSKDYLERGVRSVLDYFNRASKNHLDNEEKRVLKAVLLLQAISYNSGDSVELFIPNEKNIEHAFEGSDLDGRAAKICSKLLRDKVLFKKSLGSGKFQYGIYKDEDEVDTAQYEESIDSKSTTSFIKQEYANNTHVTDAVLLSGALKKRYKLFHVSYSDVETITKQQSDSEEKYQGKIIALICYAKNDEEGSLLGKKIQELINKSSCHLVFIDTSHTPMGELEYQRYKHASALSQAWKSKDKEQSVQYAADAADVLKKWKVKIAQGEFYVYSEKSLQGKHAATIDELYSILKEIDRDKFPYSLESAYDAYNVPNGMYDTGHLKQGVQCGATQQTAQSYIKMENVLAGAWKVDNYWEKSPLLFISKIKIAVDNFINTEFTNCSSVSIKTIYDFLKAAPYGFMACNFSAFIIGFLLKEYLTGKYIWSDSLNNFPLDLKKLQEMVDEVIKLDVTSNPRYKEKYIVAMTDEQKAFNKITSDAFSIQKNICTSVADARERIRARMKELPFPFWTLTYVLDQEQLVTEQQVIRSLIEDYCYIANNADSGESENEIAMQIGSLAIKNQTAAKDLKSLITEAKCNEGMAFYLKTFEDGALPKLAEKVVDGGRYINVLREKFKNEAEDAKWVWNKETTQQKIREVILEYGIIIESNKVLNKNVKFNETIKGWLEKCNYIRISFDAARDCLTDAGPLLEMLCAIKKAGMILDSQKEKFYELLQTGTDAFRNFYSNQIEVFRQVVNLDGLSEDEIQEIYNDIPSGVFTYDKTRYDGIVESKVNAHRDNQQNAQLRKFWKARTGSDTPLAWSKDHRMPILCLISDDEQEKAKEAFETVNRGSAPASAVKRAKEFFEGSKFFGVLSDPAALDKAFRKGVIKNYSVMLPDTNEVKDYLESNVTAEPYSWYGLPEIDKKIRQLAQIKYSNEGYKLALARIKEMDEKEILTYLKDLIQSNIDVGIEIIKSMKNA